MSDDLTTFAQTFRLDAAAVLVQIAKDESNPAAARAAAAEKILAYSDGKPVPSKPMTVADVAAMTPDLRSELLRALLLDYQVELPDQFKAMIRAAVDDALAMQAALPKPNRFRRGPLANKGPEVPRWPPTPSSTGIRGDSSGESAASGAQPPATAEPPSMRNAGDRPDNVVVQLPGTARADRLPPYGLVYGLDTDLERSRATALNPHGGVHPSVVLRAAQKDPWRGR